MTGRFRLLVAGFTLLFSAVFAADASAQRVALVAAEYTTRTLDVRAQLIRAGITDVTVIDATVAPTPTAADLMQYDVVFTWSDLLYANPVALGNALADYVDQGGGVVQGVFAFYTTPTGRWETGKYAPFTTAFYQQQSGMTLVKTADHPILAGVNSFDGGFFGFHHSGVGTQGCATIIANWSNGQPLVAARRGPNGGRIVGLNMYAPSGNAHPFFWNPTTDGHILMANAVRWAASDDPLPPSTGPVVALVAADEPADLERVKCQLQDLRLFSRVDTIDARTTSPSAAALSPYAAVLTWADVPYGDSTTLGSALADYVDLGGAVVQGAYRPYPAPGGRLDGRWRSSGYLPFTEALATAATGLSLVQSIPGHVIFNGVPSFTAGAGSYHHSPIALASATAVIGSWSDGQAMIGAGSNPSRRVVGLNLAPASSDARLVANTLLFAANHFPTVNAGADQTVEATSAAGVSLTVNATADDVDGDALTYTWSGAISTSGPSITLDLPPPPAPSKTQSHTVTLTVSDGKGAETTDSVTLTVTDTTGPVLSGVPASMLTTEATGHAGADVPFGPVTAADAVDGDTSVQCSLSGVFPIGDTPVTCSSADTRGNTSSATFTVRVTDTTPPVLAGVPAGIITVEATSASGAQAAYGPVTATDMVDGSTPVGCAPSGPFAIGDTQITCSSSDAHHNATSVSFTVRVTDTTPPVLSGVPAGILTVQATSASGAQVTYGPVTASDLVDGSTPVNCSPPSGVFPVGDTQVMCTSSDSHKNVASASFTVRVTNPSTAGAMEGHGVIHEDDHPVIFDFTVFETASGQEGGNLHVKLPSRGELMSTSITYVLFTANSVLFRGTGTWNGVPGTSFEVFATDNGTGGNTVDVLRITTDPSLGALAVQGKVKGSMIQGRRR